MTAVSKGLDAYVPVDASGTFSETKRQAGILRMVQAGVVVSDYCTLIVEILKDNLGQRPAAATKPWIWIGPSSSVKSPPTRRNSPTRSNDGRRHRVPPIRADTVYGLATRP